MYGPTTVVLLRRSFPLCTRWRHAFEDSRSYLAAGCSRRLDPAGGGRGPFEVVDRENVLLVEPNDIKGWTDRLIGLADSPTLRAQLAGAGLRLVQTRYDWEILGSRLRETYQDWLGGDARER